MNGSGITPFNSGPLLLRTYQDASPNNTYIVRKYDLPISTNYSLITSTNGQLVPSDSVYVSSMAVSSLTGNDTTISTTFESYRQTTTSIVSTATLNSTTYGGITGSSIYTNNANANAYVNVTNISTTNMIYTNMTGGPGSLVTMDNLVGNFTLTAGTFAATTFGNITFVNMSGVGNEVSNLYSTNYLNTSGVYAGICQNPIMGSVTDNISTLSTTILSTINTIGSTLVDQLLYVSTSYISTINAINANINSLNRPPIICTMNLVNVTGSAPIICSTLTASTVVYSTVTGSTTLADTLYLNTGSFSTLTGSTMIVSSLAASTLFLSSFLGSTMTFSTFTGSTMNASTITVTSLSTNQFTSIVMLNQTLTGGLGVNSTFIASTIEFSTIIGSTMNLSYSFTSTLIASTANGINVTYSTIQGSTITPTLLYFSQPSVGISSLLGSTLTTSTINASTGFYSTMLTSTLTVSTLLASSVIGSTLVGSTANIGTFYGSTVSYTGITVSTMTGSTLLATTLSYQTVTLSSISISSLLTSTVNGMVVSTMYDVTNTAIGCSSLLLTSGTNHTAIGYAALSSITSGNSDTALGYSALSNTTGSCQTAVGAAAGSIANHSGTSGLYIGYKATPSASNEIILGGSNTVGSVNTGTGVSNSMVIGNNAINKTVVYSAVGIGTMTPTTTMDVRGSYQQIGGNQSITNLTASSYVYYFLYNDNANGAGLFLNGGSRSVDGGASAATLRNDNGTLFLQAQNGSPTSGITVLTGGNIGINKAIPTNALDIIGNVNVTSSLQVTNITITGTLQGNSNTVSQTTQWSGTSPIYYTTGNVGIGTKTPGLPLDIYGSAYFTGALSVNTLSASSIRCGAINSRDKTVYVSTLATTGISCSSINAQGGTIICGNLVTSTIGGKTIPTAFPPSGVTFDNNMGIGFGNWFMTGYYTTYDTTANVPAAFSINYGPSGNGVTLSTFSFTWSSHSDRRIKQNIRGLSPVLQRFLQLRPVTYYLKADRTRGRMSGFIAQEVQRLFPLLVNDSTINPDDAFDSNLLGIQYTLFFPYLFKALQEQHAIVMKHREIIEKRKEYNQRWKQRIDEATARLAHYRSRLQAK